MISGDWGPLLSWLIVPWLLVFEDPLLAAHAAVASFGGRVPVRLLIASYGQSDCRTLLS